MIFMAGVAMPAAALAQDYPVKSIRWVVPYSPGGTSDFIARLIGQKLTEAWKQPVVVENRGGANGNIGTEIVAKAPPDGYTLLLVARALTINQSLYPNLTFDAEKDFAPITTILWQSLVLTVHPSLPVKSVKELIALARARPAELNYSSGGSGNVNHIAAELFQSMAGVKLTHVPYKSMAPALIDVLGGQIQLSMPTVNVVLPHLRSGRLRAMGVSSLQRSPTAPDVPTLAEAGMPGYEAINWFAILGPTGIPAAIAEKIHADTAEVLKGADLKERIAAAGMEPKSMGPTELAAYMKTEIVKWGKAVKASGAKAE